MLEAVLKVISDHPLAVLILLVVLVLYILNGQYNLVGSACTKLGQPGFVAPVDPTKPPTA